MSDRTVAPSSARVRRAWQAGMRVRHRWLGMAAVTWTVTALFANGWALPIWNAPSRWAAELARVDGPDVARLGDAFVHAGLEVLSAFAMLCGAAIVAWMLVGVVAGTLGPVDSKATIRVSGGRAPAIDAVWIPISIVAGCMLAVACWGVVAGCARAPGASLEALALAWRGWAVRAGTAAGAIAAFAGTLELMGEHRRLIARLHATPEELRDELQQRRSV